MCAHTPNRSPMHVCMHHVSMYVHCSALVFPDAHLIKKYVSMHTHTYIRAPPTFCSHQQAPVQPGSASPSHTHTHMHTHVYPTQRLLPSVFIDYSLCSLDLPRQHTHTHTHMHTHVYPTQRLLLSVFIDYSLCSLDLPRHLHTHTHIHTHNTHTHTHTSQCLLPPVFIDDCLCSLDLPRQ